MRRLGPGVLALLVAAANAAPASAADIAVPGAASNPEAYRPAIYNWTGFYVGGNIGAGLLQDTFTLTAATPPLQSAGFQTKVTPYGLIGGPQIGANLEFAPWVVGVEVNWTDSYISGSQVSPTLLSGPPNYLTERSTSAPHWYATATGRFGYAFDTLWLYAKGGAAWMHADYTQDILSDESLAGTSFMSVNRTGYTVGAGAEYGMTENLSAKVEYDFLDFGVRNYNFTNLTVPVGGVPTAIVNEPMAIRAYSHLFTVGLNYRFTWGGGWNPF